MPDPSYLDPRLAADTAFLRRIARGLVLDGASADDLVQESWLVALRRSRPPAGRGWLARALRFKASEQRRSETRRRLHEEVGARPEAVRSATDEAGRLEVLGLVVAALRELPEPYRKAVTLRYLDELPPREIARRMGVPVNTARSRVQRGLVKLRSALDGEHGPGRDGLLAVLGPFALPTRSELTVGPAAASWIGGIVMKKAVALSLAGIVGAVALLVWSPWAVSPAGNSADTGDDPRTASSLEPYSVGAVTVPLVDAAPPAERPARVPVASRSEDQPGWVVRGRVQKAGGGALAGIPVHVERLHGTGEAGTRLADTLLHTDAEGRFEWPLEAPGHLTTIKVLATSRDWYGWTHDQRSLPGDDAPTFEIELYPVNGELSGTVRDDEGRAIAGARLSTSTDKTSSDVEGRFRLAMASAWSQHRISVIAPGFATATVVVDQAQGEKATRVDVTLRLERILTGSVLDEDRLPVEGARVRVFGLEQDAATTDSGGRFRITGVSRTDEEPGLVAEKAGYLVTSLQASGEDVEIVLRRGAPLEGFVVDEEGRPLAGADLYVGTGAHSIETVHSWTDVDGSFRFDAVPTGRRWLTTSLEGFPVDRRRVSVASDGPAEPLVIVLGGGRSLSGRVVDEHGRALAGVRVCPQVRRERHGDPVATGAQGRFELHELAEEGSSLDLIAAGFVRRDFALDESSWSGVVIELERAGGLAGLVLDGATDEPVEAFRIRFVHPELLPDDRAVGGYSSQWSGDGLLFSGAAGRWQTGEEDFAVGAVTGIEVIAEGYAAAYLGRVVVPTEPLHADFVVRLEHGVMLTGTVFDASTGTAIEGARLYRRGVDETRRGHDNEYTAGRSWTRTGPGGRFTFAAAPTGEQVLEVDAEGFSPRIDGPFQIQRGSAEVSRSIALARGATLFGRTLDADGRPLEAAELVLADLTPDYASGRQYEWRAVTDAEGRYRIVGLPDGRYELSRRARDAASERSFTDLAQRVVIAGSDHELELSPGGTGRVLGTASRTDAEARVLAVSLLFQPEQGAEVPLDRPRLYGTLIVDGRFEFRGLPAGSYAILCGDRPSGDGDYFVGRQDLVVASGEHVETTLEINRIDWSEVTR